MVATEGPLPELVDARPAAPAVLALPPQRQRRIWLVSAVVSAFAGLFLVIDVTRPSHIVGHVGMPSLLLLGLFAATEAVVLHVQVRREARSVSMSEIPLCLGLFFVSVPTLIAVRLLGAALVWVFWRRQPLVKMAFNVANSLSEVGVAILVFQLIAGSAAADNPRTWLAAATAAALSSALAATAVTSVIAAAEGVRVGKEMLGGQLVAAPLAVAVSLVGVVTVAALSWNPWTGVPLIASAATLMLVYRAYTVLQGRHLSLERLYRFSEVVGSSPEVDGVLKTVLEQAKDLLRAERAEIMFVGPGTFGPAVGIRLGPEGDVQRFNMSEVSEGDAVWRTVLLDSAPVLMPRAPRDAATRQHLADRGLREAVVAPLRGASGVVGAVTVANRLGDVRTFDRSDVQLLETVANTASVAWQNSRLIDRLRHDALHDALTGLPNRVLLHQETATALDVLTAERSPAALPRADCPARSVAMLLADLDGFKEVNDTLGHQYGDLLLREVAQRFAGAVGDNGVVARLGGDEFAVLLPQADTGQALVVARDMLRALEQPIVLDDLSLEIAASIGVAMAPLHADQPSSLLKRADVAMYAAKAAGGGVHIYRSELDMHTPQRLGLARELRLAIKDHELQIFVQPQAILATGEVRGVEALARWRHPDQGWVNPEEFVAVAERSGLIRNLTAEVLEQSLAFAGEWHAKGRDVGISVNLSARNLHDLDLPAHVRALMREYDVPAELLTFEITESTVMTDSERNMDLLQRLSDMGIRLSIDDFGTGYSSLTHLRRLPVQEVKIDRTFVTHMSQQPEDATIAQAIIDLGNNLDLTVVAEGVEEDETWQHLVDLGCERAQGFFLGVPMPTHAFAGWLERYEHAQV